MLSNSLHKVEDTERRCSSGRQLQSQHLGSAVITSCEAHQRKNGITECSEPQTPPSVFQSVLCLSGLQFATSGSFSYTWCIFERRKRKTTGNAIPGQQLEDICNSIAVYLKPSDYVPMTEGEELEGEIFINKRICSLLLSYILVYVNLLLRSYFKAPTDVFKHSH